MRVLRQLEGTTDVTVFAMTDGAFADEEPASADWFISGHAVKR